MKNLTIKDFIMLGVIAIMSLMLLFRSPKEPDTSKFDKEIERLNEALNKEELRRNEYKDSVLFWQSRYDDAIDASEKSLEEANRAKKQSAYLQGELNKRKSELDKIKKEIEELENTTNEKEREELLNSLRKKYN